MKTNSDPLHQLIHSLSKGEKRSFKIYASRHVLGDENNYVKLFDAIEKQKEYDEEALLKKFKNEKFIIDVQNDACKSLRSLINQYCSGFCGNIENLENAGLSMLFLGRFSIAFQMLCVGFHIWSYCYPGFRFRKIWVWLLAPTWATTTTDPD